jgi:putative SOS response-associated peptidase YedK
MCYSAMVDASVKALSIRFQARIDTEAFRRHEQDRLAGSGFKSFRGFETALDDDQGLELLSRRKEREWADLRARLDEQKLRLSRAEIRFQMKATKTLANEIRIAGGKIRAIEQQLVELDGPIPMQERVFPRIFAPLLVWERGQRVLRPFRYHLRPAGEREEFDRQFDGTYNVRRDRLKEVRWWKSLYGKRHGLLVMRRFFEHVPAAGGGTRVLGFYEESENELLVPCLQDRNEEGDFPFESFALITDDPNPEVLAAGHDRTPLVLPEEAIDPWLDTESGHSIEHFDRVLASKRPTVFRHSEAV